MLAEGLAKEGEDYNFSVQEWDECFQQLANKVVNIEGENNKLQDDLLRRQNWYIKWEQEYRRHIDDLQRELRIRAGYEVNA